MHNSAGELTKLGWFSFALYMAAALLSFRAATVLRLPEVAAQRRVWFGLGSLLIALGLNKPLNLQTLLIKLGHQVADKEHLMPYRIELYAGFFTGFLLVLSAVCLLILPGLKTQIRAFSHLYPLASVGFLLICAYVVLRAASITHVDQVLRFDLERIPFLWVMEAGGLLLIIIQTVCGPQSVRVI